MKDLEKFIQVVTNNEFVEGHEVIEDQWKEWKNIPERREESFILKGLINGSTALALKVMGRENPANSVWETFEKYSPLIDTIESIHTPKYKEARALLHQKYKIFFTIKMD
jgi:hypothetical protein